MGIWTGFPGESDDAAFRETGNDAGCSYAWYQGSRLSCLRGRTVEVFRWLDASWDRSGGVGTLSGIRCQAHHRVWGAVLAARLMVSQQVEASAEEWL